MSELPNGWIIAPLSALVSSKGEFADGDWIESKDQDPDGSIRLLQLADIGDGVFIDKSHRFINEQTFDRLRCTEVFEGDVLIARMPDPLGRTCLAPKLSQRCITVVDVAIFRPGTDSVCAEWAMRFLNSPQARGWIELESSGTTRKRIARGKLAEMELPIPPLAEQKRIADKLAVVLSRVDVCRARLARVPDLLKRFRLSVLAAATSGRLTKDWRASNIVSDEWRTVTIADVTTKVGSGSTPRGGSEAYQTSGTPLIRSMNVVFHGFKEEGLAYINDEQAKALKNVEVRANDVLLNITGASIGRVTLAPAKYDGARVNQHVCILRTSEKLSAPFLSAFLAAPEMQRMIGSENYGVTRQALTKQQILDFQVPLPTLPEQKEIQRRIDSLFAFAAGIETRLTEAQTTVDRLTPSTLAKAYRGELVPQDPADEPASALIERIRAERNADAAKPRQKPAKSTPKMKKLTTDDLKQAIQGFPHKDFDFEEISRAVSADYDQLSSLLMKLLDEPSPVLRQKFDRQKKKMRFVRL